MNLNLSTFEEHHSMFAFLLQYNHVPLGHFPIARAPRPLLPALNKIKLYDLNHFCIGRLLCKSSFIWRQRCYYTSYLFNLSILALIKIQLQKSDIWYPEIIKEWNVCKNTIILKEWGSNYSSIHGIYLSQSCLFHYRDL